MCNGQLLPINQNQALFSLLGTTFGGNGQTNFALPDLRGRTPVHFGSEISLGEKGGEQAHILTQSELPTHVHSANAVAPANSGSNVNVPTANYLSNSAPAEIYRSGSGSPALVALNPGSVTNVGGSQAHENRQPLLTLTFAIALAGIYPSRN